MYNSSHLLKEYNTKHSHFALKFTFESMYYYIWVFQYFSMSYFVLYNRRILFISIIYDGMKLLFLIQINKTVAIERARSISSPNKKQLNRIFHTNRDRALRKPNYYTKSCSTEIE